MKKNKKLIIKILSQVGLLTSVKMIKPNFYWVGLFLLRLQGVDRSSAYYQKVERELASETTGWIEKSDYVNQAHRDFAEWFDKFVNFGHLKWLEYLNEEDKFAETGSTAGENLTHLKGLSSKEALHEMEGNDDDFWYDIQTSSHQICCFFNDAIHFILDLEQIACQVMEYEWLGLEQFHQMTQILDELKKIAHQIVAEQKAYDRLVDNYIKFNGLDYFSGPFGTGYIQQVADEWATSFSQDELSLIPV